MSGTDVLAVVTGLRDADPRGAGPAELGRTVDPTRLAADPHPIDRQLGLLAHRHAPAAYHRRP